MAKEDTYPVLIDAAGTVRKFWNPWQNPTDAEVNTAAVQEYDIQKALKEKGLSDVGPALPYQFCRKPDNWMVKEGLLAPPPEVIAIR